METKLIKELILAKMINAKRENEACAEYLKANPDYQLLDILEEK